MDTRMRLSVRAVKRSAVRLVYAAVILLVLMAAALWLSWVYVPFVYLLVFLLKLEAETAIGGVAVTLGLLTLISLGLFVRVVATLLSEHGHDISPLRWAVMAYPVVCLLGYFTPESVAAWAAPWSVLQSPAAIAVLVGTIGALGPRASSPDRSGLRRMPRIDIPRGPA